MIVKTQFVVHIVWWLVCVFYQLDHVTHTIKAEILVTHESQSAYEVHHDLADKWIVTNGLLQIAYLAKRFKGICSVPACEILSRKGTYATWSCG